MEAGEERGAPESAKKSWKAKIGKVPISLVEIRNEKCDDNATTHKRRLSEPLPLIPKTF